MGAVPDDRPTFLSPGHRAKLTAYLYDRIEWAAHEGWSSGKIGRMEFLITE
jgi:hypothetical protein